MTYRLLIVDDSAVTRALIRRSIQMAEFPIDPPLEAVNGLAALSLLAQQQIDLVLADLHMPQMGGAELIAQMRKNPTTANIPVVIISAEPSQERIEELCHLGAAGYLRKPFTPESLRTLLAPLLEKPHANV